MCSKSCAVLDLLQQQPEALMIQEYLDNVPSKDELIDLLILLQLKPLELIRRNEPIFQGKFKDLILTDTEWIDIMLEHPILIERPIVVKGDKAVIGRPIEKVIHLLLDGNSR